VYVHRQGDGLGARLSGVTTCGSVWHCPVCAARITEARRRELSAAMSKAVTLGLHAYLLNLTFPHELEAMSLQEQLDRQDRARLVFKNSRIYKRLLGTPKKPGQYGRAGSVCSLEVTHGENGWHPHTHDLILCRKGLADDSRAVSELKGAWIHALDRAGLSSSDTASMWDRALVLHDGAQAAEYIAKFGHDLRWGLSSEITRGHQKIGMRKMHGHDAHYTPFQLLSWANSGDDQAATLFREYARAFEGKRMLTWSPGLKALLGGADLEDEQLAESPLEPEVEVGSLTSEQFGEIIARAALGPFLEFVARCCSDAASAQHDIDVYVSWLSEQPRTHGDAVRVRGGLSPGGWMVIHPLLME